MERFETYKLPRLFVADDLVQGASITLNENQTHYFKTVLRRQQQDMIRVFNGRHGEYLASLRFEGKKLGFIDVQAIIRPQPAQAPERHIYFVLPKKKAFDLLIEKAVELGATHFHPLTSQNAQIRTIDVERVTQQILEACEQSERLEVPLLSPVAPFQTIFQSTKNLLAAVELVDAPLLGQVINKTNATEPLSFLTGPEGGFTAQERDFIQKQPSSTIINLGEAILKVETAIFLCLSAAKIHAQKAGIV